MKIWPLILVPSAFVSFGAGIVVGVFISKEPAPIVAQPVPQHDPEAPPQVAPQPPKADAVQPKDQVPAPPARKTRKQVVEEVLHDFPENAKPPFGAAYAVKSARAVEWFQKHAVGRRLEFEAKAAVVLHNNLDNTYTASIYYDRPKHEEGELVFGMWPSLIVLGEGGTPSRVDGLSADQAEEIAKLHDTVVVFKGELAPGWATTIALRKCYMNEWKITDKTARAQRSFDSPK